VVDQRRAAATSDQANAQWALRELEAALRGLQSGQVTVTVQDGVVVQVERVERRRFQRPAPKESHPPRRPVHREAPKHDRRG
jgi:hypothetical protein